MHLWNLLQALPTHLRISFMAPYYVLVLAPLRLPWLAVYSSENPLRRGQGVYISVAKRRYPAIVWETDVQPEIAKDKILPIDSVAEELPEAQEKELLFWQFISEYYLCSLNEVFKCAWPANYLKARKVVKSGAVAAKNAVKPEDLDHNKPQKLHTPEKPLLIWSRSRFEYYKQAIAKALEQGGQILILVPDSVYRKRLENFLKIEYSESILLVENAIQRGKAAYELQKGRGLIILGTKNAIFLPFKDLSLVIVDEEQDTLYKQNEKNPRYNARDCAVKLAEIHGADVILGSDFPSLESIYNSNTGKYKLLKAEKGESLGKLELIDIGAERKKRGMLGYFSRKLIRAVSGCRGKVILLRTWEDLEDLNQQVTELFPENKIRVAGLIELKKELLKEKKAELIAVLQADALVQRDAFRSDERALQLVELLRGIAKEVIIQSYVPGRFDGSKTIDSLLSERKEAFFPPYSRLLQFKREKDSEIVENFFLKRDSKLNSRKQEILKELAPYCYVDVDPI